MPQGQVLAPLQFLVIVNDLPYNVSGNTTMFADDAAIFKRERNDKDHCDSMNNNNVASKRQLIGIPLINFSYT